MYRYLSMTRGPGSGNGRVLLLVLVALLLAASYCVHAFVITGDSVVFVGDVAHVDAAPDWMETARGEVPDLRFSLVAPTNSEAPRGADQREYFRRYRNGTHSVAFVVRRAGLYYASFVPMEADAPAAPDRQEGSAPAPWEIIGVERSAVARMGPSPGLAAQQISALVPAADLPLRVALLQPIASYGVVDNWLPPHCTAPAFPTSVTAADEVSPPAPCLVSGDRVRAAIAALPVFRAFLPSFLDTVSAADTGLVRYTVYWGFDVGDPLLDQRAGLRAFLRRVRDMLAPVADRVRVRLHRFADTRGRTTPLWNGLAAEALRDGVDYVMTTNDDMVLHTPHWAEQFVATLLRSRAGRNVGVVGPLSRDLLDTGYFHAYPLMTYNFVHRTHLEIFADEYYPLPFPNGYVDPWLQDVYKAWNASALLVNVRVTNTITTANFERPRDVPGTQARPLRPARYKYVEPTPREYAAQVDAGRARIAAALASMSPAGDCLAQCLLLAGTEQAHYRCGTAGADAAEPGAERRPPGTWARFCQAPGDALFCDVLRR